MKITFISDTHNKHKQVTASLPGGDLLIHAGDLSSMGYKHEIQQFLKWFDSLNNYTHKIFICGNHDWGFQENPEMCKELLDLYNKATYLQDNSVTLFEDSDTSVKVYGAPWQPEFYNWAFNLPRMGWELEQKWNDIPDNTDILITHGPAWGHLDTVKFNPVKAKAAFWRMDGDPILDAQFFQSNKNLLDIAAYESSRCITQLDPYTSSSFQFIDHTVIRIL